MRTAKCVPIERGLALTTDFRPGRMRGNDGVDLNLSGGLACQHEGVSQRQVARRFRTNRKGRQHQRRDRSSTLSVPLSDKTISNVPTHLDDLYITPEASKADTIAGQIHRQLRRPGLVRLYVQRRLFRRLCPRM